MASGRRHKWWMKQAEELRFEEQLVWKTRTIKKAKRHKIDAFGLWCWRRLERQSLGLQGDEASPS